MSYDRLRKPRVSFTQVPNSLICSPDISCKAKAVYCYLVSRPDDWKFYTTEIVTNMKESLNTIKSAIRELIKYGWIEKQRVRDDKGQFSHTVYSLFYDVSSINQKTVGGKTCGGKTCGGKLPTTNTKLTNTKNNNTNSTSREISFQDFREQFKKDFKDKSFTLESCVPFSNDTPFKLDENGYIFNTVSSKLLSKDDSYQVWNYLYKKLKKGN